MIYGLLFIVYGLWFMVLRFTQHVVAGQSLPFQFTIEDNTRGRSSPFSYSLHPKPQTLNLNPTP